MANNKNVKTEIPLVKPKITASHLTFKQSKSFMIKFTLIKDKINDFKKEKKEVYEIKKKELRENGIENEKELEIALEQHFNDTGLDVLEELINIVFEREYDFLMSVVADIYGCSIEDAENYTIADIYDFIVRDKVVRTVFPRLAILEARALSDM